MFSLYKKRDAAGNEYEGAFLGIISNVSDIKITRTVDDGNAILEFKYIWTNKSPLVKYDVKRKKERTLNAAGTGYTDTTPAKTDVEVSVRTSNFTIEPFMRLKSSDDSWIVTSVSGSASDGWTVKAKLDRQCFEDAWFPEFVMKNVTPAVAIQMLLDMTKRRMYTSDQITDASVNQWIEDGTDIQREDMKWTEERCDYDPYDWKTYPDIATPAPYWIYESHIGIPWTIGTCTVTRERSFALYDMTALEIMNNLATVFMCEIEYDTTSHILNVKDRIGNSNSRAVFRTGLNVATCKKTLNGSGVYSAIYPLGKDGLTVNGAHYVETVYGSYMDYDEDGNYVEIFIDDNPLSGGDNGTQINRTYNQDIIYNHQYYDGVRMMKYSDDNYTTKDSLYEDMVAYLDDLSKPAVSYDIKIVDIAKYGDVVANRNINGYVYEDLDYRLGDTVLVIDSGTNTNEKMRIVKTIEYPLAPYKNTVEISNCKLSFEDLQKKLIEAAKIVDAAEQSGKITMSKVLGFHDSLNSDSTIISFNERITALEDK